MVLFDILFEFVLPIINFFGFFADMISSILSPPHKVQKIFLNILRNLMGINDDLDIDDNKV